MRKPVSIRRFIKAIQALHDKIFKQLLRVFLEDFLRLVAPRALERLDLSSPELLDKELFAGGPHDRRRELDLLARVSTRAGRPLLRSKRGQARQWRSACGATAARSRPATTCGC